MNKALIITTTSGFLSQFELNNVRLLQKKGYQVHYATNIGVPIYEVKDETLRNMGVVLPHISIEKNPFKIKKNIWDLDGWISYPDGFIENGVAYIAVELNRHDVYFLKERI